MTIRAIPFLAASLLLVTLAVAPASAEGAAVQDAPPPAEGRDAPAGRTGGGHGSAGNPALDEQLEAMERLEPWIGEWTGSGWAASPEGRSEFTIDESIQPKLDGLVLLVQGLGKSKDPETGAEMVTHDALAVVSYDPVADRYVFRHYTADGHAGESELVPIEGGWRWGFTAPGGGPEVRFTIELGEDTWRERGEVSMDGGESWFPMLDMALTRGKS